MRAIVCRSVWSRDIPGCSFSIRESADIADSLLVVQSWRTMGERSKRTMRVASFGPSRVTKSERALMLRLRMPGEMNPRSM